MADRTQYVTVFLDDAMRLDGDDGLGAVTAALCMVKGVKRAVPGEVVDPDLYFAKEKIQEKVAERLRVLAREISRGGL